MWPLDLQYNRISSGFTKRKYKGINELHKGIDITANAGAKYLRGQLRNSRYGYIPYSYGN